MGRETEMEEKISGVSETKMNDIKYYFERMSSTQFEYFNYFTPTTSVC